MATPKKVKIIVHSMDGKNEEKEAFIGVNGKGYQVRLGEEVEVTADVVDTLKNAVETKHTPVKNAKGELTGEIKEKKQPRYVVEKL